MKKTLALVAVATLFTSCISLPKLDAKYEVLAKDLSTYTCMAKKAGLLNDNADLTTDQLKALAEQYKGQGATAPTTSPEDIDKQLDELGKDPVQMALFFQALVGNLTGCTSNSNS